MRLHGDTPKDQRIIFVVGSGRSGTHWLGNLLDEHPDIVTTIEDSRVFPKVTAMALNPALEDRHLPKVIRFYRRQLRRAGERHYADKSHPNLWIAEKLADEFGDSARFLGIERNPFAVAASSLRHKHVAAWNQKWRDYPIPNRFLGIDTQLSARYDGLSDAEKFAHRWSAHHREMRRVRGALAGRMHVVQYEDLSDSLDRETRSVWECLGVRAINAAVQTKVDSRDKWREQLTEEQVASISHITGQVPD